MAGKPRGRNGFAPASVEKHCTAKREEISAILKDVVKWQKQPKVKSDDELEERVEQFFQTCIDTGEIPSVEKLCLAIGSYRQEVWNWEQGTGCSQRRVDIIKRAKQAIAAMDAELVANRKIPETTYIFRSKNYYGMKDQQEVVVAPSNPLGEEQDPQLLAEKYAATLPLREGVDYPSTMPQIEDKR